MNSNKMTLLRKSFTLLLVFLSSYTIFSARGRLTSPNTCHGPCYNASAWYNWGLSGISPTRNYHSFTGTPTRPNVILKNDACDAGLLFVEPLSQGSGQSFMILNNHGDLVWMPKDSLWNDARNVKVQTLDEEKFITFLYGTDTSAGGQAYAMIDSSYRLSKIIKPIGDIRGQLSGLRITADRTALVIIHHASTFDKTSTKPNGPDTIFQEIDIHSGNLLFEWRASRHVFAQTHSRSYKNTPAPFQIQNIDKDLEGNYLISSGHTTFCVSGESGKALWQLGGIGNEFHDISAGRATALSSNHHATWHNNTTLLITNHGSHNSREIGGKDTGIILMFVHLTFDKLTAQVIKAIDRPSVASHSLDNIQLLGNNNVLGQDTATSKVIEFSNTEILCETSFTPSQLPSRWTTHYRVSKYEWFGQPDTTPDIVVRPEDGVIYVSWNGATDIDSWVLQSGPKVDGTHFIDHLRVEKTGFETRIELPKRTEEYIRMIALDKTWKLAAYSPAVSKLIRTGTGIHGPRRFVLPTPISTLGKRGILIVLVVVIMAYCYVAACLPVIRRLWHRDTPSRKAQ